jgi:membrane protease YdiL (CAAX protease family)
MDRVGRRRAAELALVIGCGAGNVVFENLLDAKTIFMIVAAAAWVGYVAWRWHADHEVLRAWGLRLDNLAAAAKVALAITLPTVIGCVAYAFVVGNFPPPPGFWVILLVYPIWGVAQQFLLNAILASDLDAVLPAWAATLLAAALFSLSHAPDLPVMALTLPGGALWVLVYRRRPNLWALGIAHGIIGTVVFYGVLGRDPMALLLGQGAPVPH